MVFSQSECSTGFQGVIYYARAVAKLVGRYGVECETKLRRMWAPSIHLLELRPVSRTVSAPLPETANTVTETNQPNDFLQGYSDRRTVQASMPHLARLLSSPRTTILSVKYLDCSQGFMWPYRSPLIHLKSCAYRKTRSSMPCQPLTHPLCPTVVLDHHVLCSLPH